jgi:endonuclease/exonuclease/phosphatase family metal-dependent hydrolase
LSKTAFISDFTTLLEGLISTPSEIVITGDFNFHCDQPTDPTVSPFLELLDVFGLKQHISFPTHDSGHTLDLIITRATSSFVSSSSSSFTPISDHLLILSNFSIPVKSRPTRTIKTTRPINKIDTE